MCGNADKSGFVRISIHLFVNFLRLLMKSGSGRKRAGKFIGGMTQCIFAEKAVVKIILYWKGLTKGYSKYGGSE